MTIAVIAWRKDIIFSNLKKQSKITSKEKLSEKKFTENTTIKIKSIQILFKKIIIILHILIFQN